MDQRMHGFPGGTRRAINGIGGVAIAAAIGCGGLLSDAAQGAEPRYPQEFAEIMGGRIPLSPTQAEMPRSLLETMVGERTAREIGWLKAQ